MIDIPHNRLSLGPDEMNAAERVLASGWLARGTEVAAFEREMCEFHGLADGYALAVSSGSAALYLALRLLGAAGRRVVYPAYACDSLRQAIRLANGEPVAVDVAPDSPLIDWAAAERASPDIVICAGMFGLPCRVPAARSYRVVADAAQTLGAYVEQRPYVLSGDIGILSFSATKLMTTGGQGGMLVARDRSLIDAARDFCDFDARGDDAPHFNLQMTDLAATIGRAQLARLPHFLERRAMIFSRYRALGMPMLELEAGSERPVFYRTVLRHADPEALIAALARSAIRAIAPVAAAELAAHPPGAMTNARCLAATTVSLPCYPTLNEPELTRVTAALLAAAKETRA